MPNLHSLEFLAEAFQCHVHHYRPGGTVCDEAGFPVLGRWDSRDISVAGVCDCVKECMSFVM